MQRRIVDDNDYIRIHVSIEAPDDDDWRAAVVESWPEFLPTLDLS